MKFIKITSIIIGLIVLVFTVFFGIISIKEKIFPSISHPELKYKISFLQILDNEQIQTCSNQFYKYILREELNKKYVEKEDEEDYGIIRDYSYNDDNNIGIDTIKYYEVQIKNVGGEVITFNDIHKNNPLRISMEYMELIGACISKQTPSYIGATLNTNQEGNIFIKFERINKNDSVFIKILLAEPSYSNMSMNVFGSGDYFSPNIKPLDLETAKYFGSYEEQMEFGHIKKIRILLYLLISIISVLIVIIPLIFLHKKYKQKHKN